MELLLTALALMRAQVSETNTLGKENIFASFQVLENISASKIYFA